MSFDCLHLDFGHWIQIQEFGYAASDYSSYCHWQHSFGSSSSSGSNSSLSWRWLSP